MAEEVGSRGNIDVNSKANIVRRFVLAHPNLSPSEAKAKFDAEGKHPGLETTKQNFFVARNLIKTKYGVPVSELPLKPNGELNITGILRLLLNKNPNLTFNAAKAYTASDGLDNFSKRLFKMVAKGERPAPGSGVPSRRVKERKASTKGADVQQLDLFDEEEDPLLRTGPRDRYVPPKGRPPGSKNKKKGPKKRPKGQGLGITIGDAERSVGTAFLRWEDELDDLVQQARDESNDELVERLKVARRSIIGALHELMNVVSARG